MPIMRALVTLPGQSALPEDVVVNTFHFLTEDTTDATVDEISAQVQEFFNVVPPAVTGGVSAPLAIGATISNWINRAANACSIKVYDMADPAPRIPRER